MNKSLMRLKMSEKDILKTEFSEKFIDEMKVRMITSFFKYGAIKDGFPYKVSAIKSALLAIEKYKNDKNLEHLCDAANYLMIEFMLPSEEGTYFKSTDSGGSIGRKCHNGPATKKRNEDL